MTNKGAVDWLDGYIKGKYRDISIPVAKLAIEALEKLIYLKSQIGGGTE